MQREREGEKSADRRALLRSERGEGGAAWAVRAERAAPLGRVRVASEGGELGRQRPNARGERGVCWARVWGWAKIGEGVKDKRKILLYFPKL